jgi:hypothetical protein
MSNTRNLIDYASQDNGTEFRNELYAAIHDKVSDHINSKKQEIASGLMGQQFEEEVELIENHVDQFSKETGLSKAHAQHYASGIAKYPNNDRAAAEHADNAIQGPRMKVKFHQSPSEYQDKKIAHVKTMKGIMGS